MRYAKWTIFTVCAAMSFFLAVETTSAQSFTPNTPTMSPWLGFLNRPDNDIDNYNRFIRPQFESQRSRAAQQQAIDSLQRQNRALQNQMLDFGAGGPSGVAGAPSGGTAQPPGIQMRLGGYPSQAATFRNYSHFYPNARR